MSPLEVAAYRRRIEDQIEQLIATLDDLDGNTEDDEPSLGWTAAGALGAADDREDDECSGFADCDALESEDRDHQSFRSGITPRQRAVIDALAHRSRLSNDCPTEPARRPR